LKDVLREPQPAAKWDRLVDEEAVRSATINITGFDFLARLPDDGIRPGACLASTPARGVDAGRRRDARGIALQGTLFQLLERDRRRHRRRSLGLRRSSEENEDGKEQMSHHQAPAFFAWSALSC
jgi:hypothetical protein